MDEAVWIAIGIISILLVIGILAGFLGSQRSGNAEQLSAQSLDELNRMCTMVCAMPDDTYLSTTVRIPAGVIVSAQDRLLCIDDEETTSCLPCSCNLGNYSLNLTVPEAKAFFASHEYRCFFLKSPGTITMECKG
jgi:hypothetical protein